jgi:hypothetical protein
MSKSARKPHPLAARIKRVMQADDEVGKIAQATPFLMGARGGDLGSCCWLSIGLLR